MRPLLGKLETSSAENLHGRAHSAAGDEIARFCRRHRVRRLALFGSVLRDDFGRVSDVDVLVEFDPDQSPGWELITMQDELSTLLGRKVDLNTPGFLSRYFRDKSMAEAETIYERA